MSKGIDVGQKADMELMMQLKGVPETLENMQKMLDALGRHLLEIQKISKGTKEATKESTGSWKKYEEKLKEILDAINKRNKEAAKQQEDALKHTTRVVEQETEKQVKAQKAGVEWNEKYYASRAKLIDKLSQNYEKMGGDPEKLRKGIIEGNVFSIQKEVEVLRIKLDVERRVDAEIERNIALEKRRRAMGLANLGRAIGDAAKYQVAGRDQGLANLGAGIGQAAIAQVSELRKLQNEYVRYGGIRQNINKQILAGDIDAVRQIVANKKKEAAALTATALAAKAAAAATVKAENEKQRAAARSHAAISQGMNAMASMTSRVVNGIINLRNAIVLMLGVQAVKAIVKFGMDFEQSLAEVDTQITRSEGKIQDFHDGILKMSKELPFKLKEFTEAAYEAISSQAVMPNQTLPFMQVVGRLAVAGKGSIADTTKAMTDMLNTFQLKASDAADVADRMFEAVRLGNLRIDEFAQDLGMVASQAATAGLSVDEFMGSLSSITTRGLSLDKAMTSMARFLESFIAPGRQATETIKMLNKALGTNFEMNEMAIKERGYLNVIKELRDILEEIPEDKLKVLQRIQPNIRGMRGAVIQTITGFEKFLSDTKAMEKAAGSVEEAYAKMIVTLENRVILMKNKVIVAVVEIYEQNKETFLSFVSDVEEAIDEHGGDIVAASKVVFSSLRDIFDLLNSFKTVLFALGKAFIAAFVVSHLYVFYSAITKMGLGLVFLLDIARKLIIVFGMGGLAGSLNTMKIVLQSVAVGMGIATIESGKLTLAISGLKLAVGGIIAVISTAVTIIGVWLYNAMRKAREANDELSNSLDRSGAKTKAQIERIKEYKNQAMGGSLGFSPSGRPLTYTEYQSTLRGITTEEGKESYRKGVIERTNKEADYYAKKYDEARTRVDEAEFLAKAGITNIVEMIDVRSGKKTFKQMSPLVPTDADIDNMELYSKYLTGYMSFIDRIKQDAKEGVDLEWPGEDDKDKPLKEAKDNLDAIIKRLEEMAGKGRIIGRNEVELARMEIQKWQDETEAMIAALTTRGNEARKVWESLKPAIKDATDEMIRAAGEKEAGKVTGGISNVMGFVSGYGNKELAESEKVGLDIGKLQESVSQLIAARRLLIEIGEGSGYWSKDIEKISDELSGIPGKLNEAKKKQELLFAIEGINMMPLPAEIKGWATDAATLISGPIIGIFKAAAEKLLTYLWEKAKAWYAEFESLFGLSTTLTPAQNQASASSSKEAQKQADEEYRQQRNEYLLNLRDWNRSNPSTRGEKPEAPEKPGLHATRREKTEMELALEALRSKFVGWYNKARGSLVSMRQKLPGLFKDIRKSIIKELPAFLSELARTLPKLIAKAIPVIKTALGALVSSLLTAAAAAAPAIITQTYTWFMGDFFPLIIESIPMMITAFIQGFVESIPLMVTETITFIPRIVVAVINAFIGIMPMFAYEFWAILWDTTRNKLENSLNETFREMGIKFSDAMFHDLMVGWNDFVYKTVPETIKNTFKGFFSIFSTGVFKGLKQAFVRVFDWLKEQLDKLNPFGGGKKDGNFHGYTGPGAEEAEEAEETVRSWVSHQGGFIPRLHRGTARVEELGGRGLNDLFGRMIQPLLASRDEVGAILRPREAVLPVNLVDSIMSGGFAAQIERAMRPRMSLAGMGGLASSFSEHYHFSGAIFAKDARQVIDEINYQNGRRAGRRAANTNLGFGR